MTAAVIAGVGVIVGAALLVGIVRLLVPRKGVTPSAENNWEQRNDLAGGQYSPDAADSLSPIDVAIGLEVDSGGAL